MRIFSLLLVCCVMAAAPMQAQSRMNVDLYRWLRSVPADSSIHLLVKGKANRLRELTETKGGLFKYQAGDIASVRLSAAAINELSKNSDIERMEVSFAPLQSLHIEDSSALYNNNVSPAHQGWGDLPQGFRGGGVLVGGIDDGFDWEHPDFRYSDGRTRVRYLWDQNLYDPYGIETRFGYGSAWDSITIQNGQSPQIPMQHGTHVAGIAAGNGLASGKYLGIAPESNLLWVKILGNQGWMTGFVDGLAYMFEQADSLGMPIAVNSSLGTYGSAHDGKDLYSQLVENLINNRPGHVFVQAAGNAREYDFHLGVTQTDTAYTWFKYHNGGAKMHFVVYADTADFNHLDFSLQMLDTANYQPLASTTWYNIPQDIPLNNSVGTVSQVLFMNGLGQTYTLEIYVSEYAGVYEIYIEVIAPPHDNYWQFKTKGVGKYDVWSAPSLTGTSVIIADGQGSRYRRPDNEKTLAGYWTCAESVIVSAAYQNQSIMINYAQDTFVLNTMPDDYPTGGIWFRSSLGPTRDGRQKPDVTAPGGQVLSAIPVEDLVYYRSIFTPKLDIDGWHFPNQGTSMAAPMVTGAAALYLQCNPNATQAELRQKLHQHSRIDSFVLKEIPNVPNIHWGYGKLDVFELLKSCLVYGCTDTNAVNYNPLAMVDDSSCIVFPPVANTAPHSLQLAVLPSLVARGQTVTIQYQSDLQVGCLALYDALGQCLYTQNITHSNQTQQYPTHQLSAGLYWWLFTDTQGNKKSVPMGVW